MITKEEVQELLHSTETYRVERTTSTGDMDKFQEAIEQLEDYSSCGDDMVSPSVIGTIGNCYAELGQNEKAVEMLVKAANKADNNTLSPIYLIQAGQIYESLNQNEKALDCYNQIKTKYQQSMQYNEVDKYIERVKK